MMSDPIYAPAWTSDALCAQVDADLFFPKKGGTNTAAKKVCGKCVCREACLQYALAHDERHGIYGGLSADERRPLRQADAA